MINPKKLLLQFPPVAFGIKKSKKIILPGFEGLPLYDVVVFFLSQLKKTGLNERAAAISFNFMMAIPAAIIFLFTLVPFIPGSDNFNEELLRLTADLTPNKSTYDWVATFLNDFLNTPRNGLLSFGFLIVLFYSSNAMMGIMRSFDKSIIHARKRKFMEMRWTAIRLTIIVILLIILTIFLLILQGNLLDWFLTKLNWYSAFSHNLIAALRWLLIALLFFISIAIIYKYAPSVHERWNLVSPGALLATSLIILLAIGFSFWISKFNNFNKLYGSIGTVMILMLLIFLNSLILIIGFELNVSISSLKQEAALREKADNELMESNG